MKMMKKFLTTLAASLCFSSLALAGGALPVQQPAPYAAENGPYFGIHGGAAWAHSDFDFTHNDDFTHNNDNDDIDLDTGFDVGAQLGYRFTQNVRVEGAFTYIRNDFDDDDNGKKFNDDNHHHHDNDDNDAHLNSYLGMVNAFYDLHLFPIIDPFVGFGIGFDHLSFESDCFNHDNHDNHDNDDCDNDDTKFAYQAIAGLGFNVMPNALLSARYRFVGTAGSHDLHYNILEASFDYFI